MSGANAVFSAVVAMALCACSGGSTTGPGSNNNNSQFFMRANIDGAWQATFPAPASLVAPGTYSMTGAQTGGYVLIFQLFNIRGPGSYPLGVGAQVPGGVAQLSNQTSGWSTPLSGAAGTIEITSLTPTNIAGKFNFTATGITGGATTTKTATNGEFNLQLNTIGTVGPLPDNAGSTLSATLNGASWNAAAVASGLTGTQNTLVVTGGNNTHAMTISIAGVTAPGTYTLSNAASRTITVANAAASQIWSSANTGGSGSVIVTSVTATRVRGTFTATLGPTPGTPTTGTVTLANGTFDIGRN